MASTPVGTNPCVAQESAHGEVQKIGHPGVQLTPTIDDRYNNEEGCPSRESQLSRGNQTRWRS